ncbi:hypothetical protein [Nostoc sp.]|uniref:hypothetical protein n=1 Tax=Nostoc sp. TaxID=1180 RepID=UPI002FFD1CAE
MIVFNVIDVEDNIYYLKYKEIQETKVADEGKNNDDYLDAKYFQVIFKNGDIILLEMDKQNELSQMLLYRLLMRGE